MNSKKDILKIGLSCWAGLGFIRGTQYYNYTRSYYESGMYINMFASGIYGIMLYVNPFFVPFIIYKELYRLEVCIRNLEDEKHTDFYKKIL